MIAMTSCFSLLTLYSDFKASKRELKTQKQNKTKKPQTQKTFANQCSCLPIPSTPH